MRETSSAIEPGRDTIQALIVETAGEQYAIPQDVVRELVRAASGGQAEHRIEYLNGTPVLRLREQLLPLVSLRAALLRAPAAPGADSSIVVCQVAGGAFGIIVDRVFETEEITPVGLASALQHLTMFAGSAILRDERVVLVLEIAGLIAGIAAIDADVEAKEVALADARPAANLTEFLLFRSGTGAPKAVPLALVARLEQFDARAIELSDGQPVIQYRGKLMKLATLDGAAAETCSDVRPALVFVQEGRSIGLLVDEIVDIVAAVARTDLDSDQPGVVGSAIIEGQATDLIDIGHHLNRLDADWFGSRAPFQPASAAAGTGKRVLLVDDSAFFRNLLAPMLASAGYEVTAADGPLAALELCAGATRFDAVVSDIEMPDMSGFDLAARLRAEPSCASTALIALSSHAAPQDLARGIAAGFDVYIPKLDRAALLASLSKAITGLQEAA